NMTRASDFDEWLRQTERCAVNINMYYADKDGNIGYVFAGKYPKRNPGHDNRLPVSGNGDMDWEAILPFSQNPQVYNPEQGYITNWNNRPAMGIPNPDLFWFVWAKAERVQALIDRLEEKDKFNADDMWNLISQTSFLDVSIPYFKPFLEKVGEVSSDQRVKDAVQVLTQWDNVSTDKDNDGRFDQSATAIFRTFLSYMVEYTLSDDLSDVFPLFADTGYPSGEYVSGGVKTIVEALIDPESQGYDLFNGKTPEAVIESAFTAALDELTQEYGASMDDWKLPVMKFVFSPKNFQNVPQADEDETLTLPITMNRGTENNMTVFTENSVIGYEVTPPGQSGFISPAGVKNRHYDDQLRLYAEFGKKRTWIYPEDVENDSESVTVLELK
ncbi:MAG: hypothetical protein GY749_45300, partial [Desulfobacteraceae bacterium]|nr:hypothetical protein [Desulfobacteraceae bacterium]